MKKERLYKESEKFEIFCNYGVLSREGRNVYTYNAEHPWATCSDCLVVKMPANDWYNIFETTAGVLAVESSWGWMYSINDVLQGDEYPCFFAIDADGKGHRVRLEEI